MLEELLVTNLGVVREASVTFSPGLNVITGETGAGKTLVVEALQLLLGGRADAGLVGPFGPEARVDGRFRATPQVRAALEPAGLDCDELVVSRRVPSQGQSRAWLNGRPVTAGLLADMGEHLVAVHGQHAHRRLAGAAAARHVLDILCVRERAAYDAAWRAWREAVAALGALGGSPAERAREIDLLRHQVKEIEDASPVPGEMAGLEERIERLSNAEALRDATFVAMAVLAGAGTDAIGEAVSHLRGAPGTSLDAVASLATALQDQVSDLARELRALSEQLEADPDALDAAVSRRSLLTDLRRKYGDTTEEVLEFAGSARERLEALERHEDVAARLSEEERSARADVEAAGLVLREARLRSADSLSRDVVARLPSLALPGASLLFLVEPAELGEAGADRVTVLFTANTGIEPLPLSRVGSGGELSRVMLALELSLRDPDVPSLVFDEVDAGIGGTAGAAVGSLLAELATRTQVFCVTHLPQVASHAATHLGVTKAAGEARVATLGLADRARELSRMLAGHEGSEAARAHAEELLAAARARRR